MLSRSRCSIKGKYTKYFLLRLVPCGDKTTITIISQINGSNDTHNLYILSRNLLMFTLRNHCNNHYIPLTSLKYILTTKNLAWWNLFLKPRKFFLDTLFKTVLNIAHHLQWNEFRFYRFSCIFYISAFAFLY